jgi:hypothetical protein
LTVVGLYPRPGRVPDPVLGHKREWSEFRDDPEPSKGAGLSRVVHQEESNMIDDKMKTELHLYTTDPYIHNDTGAASQHRVTVRD